MCFRSDPLCQNGNPSLECFLFGEEGKVAGNHIWQELKVLSQDFVNVEKKYTHKILSCLLNVFPQQSNFGRQFGQLLECYSKIEKHAHWALCAIPLKTAVLWAVTEDSALFLAWKSDLSDTEVCSLHKFKVLCKGLFFYSSRNTKQMVHNL